MTWTRGFVFDGVEKKLRKEENTGTCIFSFFPIMVLKAFSPGLLNDFCIILKGAIFTICNADYQSFYVYLLTKISTLATRNPIIGVDHRGPFSL